MVSELYLNKAVLKPHIDLDTASMPDAQAIVMFLKF